MPQFWKQFINNPKSMSSDSIATPSHSNLDQNNNKNISTTTPPRIRPTLSARPNSFHTPSSNNQRSNNKLGNSNSTSNRIVTTPTDDYKIYRDQFLNNKNGFTGRVFGVSLSDSLSIASAEVIVQSELVSFGRIPIVVAKCGAYLKSNGLETSGIFRIAGNSKRVKELQYIFSRGPDYGAKFNNWDGYTVHDVASLLRRFLNNLQEPLIPLSLYESFRSPLRNRPRILKHMQLHSISHPNANKDNSLTMNDIKEQNSNITTTSKDNNNNSNNNIDNDTEIVDITTENTETTTLIEKDPKLIKDNQNMQIKNDNDDNDNNNNKETLPECKKENVDTDESNKDENDEQELKRKKKLRHKKRLSRDIRAALKDYETLFIQLSNDTKQLTIYLLDLLSLFARQSQFNLMSGRNLAAIFQPSFLSHPQHDMDPKEYELSRFVVEFLIEYSYKLLPHLLKIAKKEQQDKLNVKTSISSTSPVKRASSPLKKESTPPMVTFNNNNNNPLPSSSSLSSSPTDINSKKTSIKRASSSSLKPPTITSSLSYNKQHFNTALRRPHSKSIGSVPTPPDVIVSNKRKTTLFPWLHKPGILSDAGDSTATEAEDGDDDYDDDPSPISITTNNNKTILTVPKINRSLSGNSTSFSTFKINGGNSSNGSVRPVSMVLDNVLSKNHDEDYLSSNEIDNEKLSKSKKRESWFQRLTR